MNKLKIGLLLDDGLDAPDGVQQYVLTLGAWLSAQGHDVHYLVGETSRTDIPNVHSLATNLRVKFNGNRLSIPLPVRQSRLRALLAEQSFDVVHVQVPYSPFFAGRLLKLLPSTTAVVGTFHVLPYGRLVAWANQVLALLNRQTARRFTAMITSTEPTAAFAKATYGFDSVVIPHPIQLASFSVPAEKHALPTVVFLGRLVERKGPLELLKAVKYIREHQLVATPFRVILGGKGPLLPLLDRYIRANGLRDVVKLTGFVAENEKAQFLAQADVAVFPSLSGESFGISLLEALAASGGVVLGGDNPGYRAVLSPLDENRLVQPRNIADFAKQLAHWLSAPKACKQAATDQKRYVQDFDIATVGAKVLKTYEQALREQRNVR